MLIKNVAERVEVKETASQSLLSFFNATLCYVSDGTLLIVTRQDDQQKTYIWAPGRWCDVVITETLDKNE